MTEEQFKAQFEVVFLATWCATEYEQACMNGQHERVEKPPVEDARFLAEKAWEHRKWVLGE